MMIKCSDCKSEKFVVKVGKRHNKLGDKQKYRCNKCWTWFVQKDAFWHRKYSKEIIAEACSCYKRGMGFKETAEHLNEYKGTKIAPATVFYWTNTYAKILKKNDG